MSSSSRRFAPGDCVILDTCIPGRWSVALYDKLPNGRVGDVRFGCGDVGFVVATRREDRIDMVMLLVSRGLGWIYATYVDKVDT